MRGKDNQCASVNTEQISEEKYCELKKKYDELNGAYEALSAECGQIKTSEIYRISKLIWKIAEKLHLIKFARFLLLVKRTGLKEALSQKRAYQKQEKEAKRHTPILDPEAGTGAGQEKCFLENGNTLVNAMRQKQASFAEVCGRPWGQETRGLYMELSSRSHKGIIVYPSSSAERVQDIQQMLNGFAEEGFLCFVCADSGRGSGFEEVRKNLFTVCQEEALLPLLQNHCPIVLIEETMQIPFADALDEKLLWLHIRDDAALAAHNTADGAKPVCEALFSAAAVVTCASEQAAESLSGKAPVVCIGETGSDAVTPVIEALSRAPRGLYAWADFAEQELVAVEAVTFFKYDGSNYYSGGAERYLLDLYEVCSEMRLPYRVYQYGEYNWVRYYNDVEVVGIAPRVNNVNEYTSALIDEMDGRFAREVSESCRLGIFSPFFIHCRKCSIPTLGISHGISWDNDSIHFKDGNHFWQVNKNVIDAASYCDQMISVDTNTCNWFQTLDYDTGRKITYIPNYVDNEEFCPRKDYLMPRDRVIITYPRRLYAARGLYVVLDILDDILEKYRCAEFHFVGKGFDNDTRHVKKKIAKWGDRVKWYSKPPDQMYKVYQYSDISLIPTMYSEGTSLSCLEALSSGNAVIATRIGGLTDLVFNDYNGKLVEPTGAAIKEAIMDLLDHPEKMRALKENAVRTANSFSKLKWKQQWKNIFSQLPVTQKADFKVDRCLVKLQSPDALSKTETIHTIRQRLERGCCVYVACPDNPLRHESYKRLQYIDLNEELYFTPEEIIAL